MHVLMEGAAARPLAVVAVAWRQKIKDATAALPHHVNLVVNLEHGPKWLPSPWRPR